MSIGSLMRTSVSGMNAQATRLSAVSDNIANSNTNGYKQATTEFSTQILAHSGGQYNSGAVDANVRTLVSQQGGITYTANSTNSKKVDLAIQGNGFLVVGDGAGGSFLTRAGAFTQQADGTLVNAAGYTLMGYPVTAGGTDYTLNGYAGLKEVNMGANLLSANPTTKGELTANLDMGAEKVDTTAAGVVIPSAITSATAADAKITYTSASSLTVYDNSGKAVKLDVYYTKTDDNTWEMSVFNAADASPSTGTNASTTAPFPYGKANGTGTAPLQTSTLTFDPATGKLTEIDGDAVDTASKNGFFNIDLSDPTINGQKIALNISDFTQYTKEYSPLVAKVDGNPAEVIDKVSIGTDGTVTATFTSGTTRDLYKIPLAMVQAPDNLIHVSGNAYSAGVESGTILMGFGGDNGFGDLISGALEESTVDLASELTTMIESQRSYTANSKVFQTGSEIMDVLVNLKR
ncbi:flagellar hook protein FlgE [Aureimonas jatrophae]|uniref:Flagellar hook protein FlgE n=1 Tax=Aureimonas jatrophae TaxID=1166073 RepID=A0A1H0JFJ8_9HYPH|nr:flagellar hook protein FlgE [Aureimonas jatrophae]MBB3951431.1 flagellar hook protein FlgE [Aureimonas jatrophae]SDO42527.1 flagellar hook protein FlgE [Aureimonas jatrophae]